MAFYLKIKNFSLYVLIFLVWSTSVHAQEENTYWQVEYGLGNIIKHKEIVGHLVTAHPEYFNISWHKNAAVNKHWQERYNFLDWGIALNYQKFNNTTLGNVIALQYQTTFYLLNRNTKNQLNFSVATGLGYATNPLSLENNNQNVAMSSKIQLAETLRLNYHRPYLIDHIGFHAGLAASHFSNASYKSPNFGINSLLVTAGLSYNLSNSPSLYPERKKPKKLEKQSYHLSLSIFSGLHEVKTGLGTKPILGISSSLQKRINYKSNLQFGIDYFNSQAVKDFSNFRYHTQIEYPDRKLLDHQQVGIFTGHELFFNKISFETLLGYYIYNPLKFNPSVYQKIAIKHHLNNKKTAISANLKVYKTTAEYLTIGFHYQIH